MNHAAPASALLFALALPASAAELVQPVDVAVGGDGAIVVADPGAHALLRLEGGAVHVLAQGPGRPGTPLYGVRHVAPHPDGGFVASDPATAQVYRVTATGALTPLGGDALVLPWGLAVSPEGTVFVADRALRRILALGGETLADVAGVRGLVMLRDGALVAVTDTGLLRARAGRVEPLVVGEPFQLAHDAAALPDGSLLVSDGYAGAIVRVKPGAPPEPFVRGAPLQSPQGLALDRDGSLLVADPRARAVFRVGRDREIRALGDGR